MLKRLYDIVLLYREYILLGVFLATSIALLSQNDNRQIRTLRSLTVVSIGYLQEAFSFIPGYFSLRRENQVLRELNLTLSEEVSRLREGKIENMRLHNLLALKESLPYRSVSAAVVGKTLLMLRNTITLDVGDVQGIRVNMPIVSDEGLVGKITATGNEYSVGQLLFNREMRVSAKVQRSRVDGIIRWDGGSTLTLGDVARTLDVRVGDLVITSDYSNIFPAGIRIGIVASVHELPGSLFQAIDVAPSVDFQRLEAAFVLTYVPDSTRVSLEKHIRE